MSSRVVRTNINLSEAEVKPFEDATKRCTCKTRMEVMRELLLQITSYLSSEEIAEACSGNSSLGGVLARKMLNIPSK